MIFLGLDRFKVDDNPLCSFKLAHRPLPAVTDMWGLSELGGLSSNLLLLRFVYWDLGIQVLRLIVNLLPVIC